MLGTPLLDEALPLLAKERATDVLIGHGHFNIVDHPFFDPAMASMKRVLLSGAKVPDRVFEAFETRGIWVGQTFGMGEGLFTMSSEKSSREARRTTVGVPVSPYDEFRVVAPGTEVDLPDGATGEFVCRGPTPSVGTSTPKSSMQPHSPLTGTTAPEISSRFARWMMSGAFPSRAD